MKSPLTLTLGIVLLATACASMNDRTPPASATNAGASKTVTVYLLGMDNFNWEGWYATSRDIPNLVQEYHPQSIIIRGNAGVVVSYSDAQRICSGFRAAGVNSVEIASGGITGQ